MKTYWVCSGDTEFIFSKKRLHYSYYPFVDAALYTPSDDAPARAHWDTKRAVEPLAHAAARFRKVDIKGQLS